MKQITDTEYYFAHATTTKVVEAANSTIVNVSNGSYLKELVKLINSTIKKNEKNDCSIDLKITKKSKLGVFFKLCIDHNNDNSNYSLLYEMEFKNKTTKDADKQTAQRNAIINSLLSKLYGIFINKTFCKKDDICSILEAETYRKILECLEKNGVAAAPKRLQQKKDNMFLLQTLHTPTRVKLFK